MESNNRCPLGNVNMADEQTTTGRCGWILLAFIFLFLYGLLPGSFMGGIAGLKAVGAVPGQLTGSDLVMRLFVLAGMIVSFLVIAIISMLAATVVIRITGNRNKQSTASNTAGEKVVSLER